MTAAPVLAAALVLVLAACVGALEAPRLRRWRLATGAGATVSTIALIASIVAGSAAAPAALAGATGGSVTTRTGSTANSPTGPLTTPTGTSGVTGSRATAGASTASAGSGVPLPPALTQAGPGVSATSVTLGFEVLDNLGAASAAAGIANSNQFGNGTDQVSAIVNYLNSHGGLYGRKVVAAVEHYDATSQDSTQSDQICTKFTEDDHAFAVVLTTVDSDTDSIMQCYAQHQTMIFNDYEYSDGFYRALWPYAWNADQPSQDVMSATLIDGLKSRGFFTGKLGILSVDEPEDRDAVNNVILPRLQSLGFTNYTVQYVTYNTQGQVVQQIGAAELSFSQSGVDHVIFPGDIGGGLAGYFMIAASQQKYYPWYGLDSDNQPAQAVASGSIPLDEYAKMLGVGMAEIYDLNDAQGDEFPNAREKRCADVMAAAGITFPIRDDATTALTYCDFAFAIHDVTQAAGGTLSAAAFGAAAPRSGYASAIPYTTQFGSQRPWGAASYRETKFDTGCSCLVYVSGVFQAPSS